MGLSWSRAVTALPSASQSVVPMTMVGRGLPAYSSSGTASQAVDNPTYPYATTCNTSGDPAYIAIDISSVVGAMATDGSGFKSMVLTWYGAQGIYQPNLHGDSNAGLPGNYTIDTNAAAGGSYPSSGWVTGTGANAVTGNLVQSRTHIVNVANSNWIRLSVSQQADGSTGGNTLNIDLWDASHGSTQSSHSALNCGWIFYGDSITHRTMEQDNVGQGGPSYASAGAMVYGDTGYWCLQECAGIDGYTSSELLVPFSTWVGFYPGLYCALCIGTNDANGSTVSTTQYASNVTSMINTIVNAGKIAVVDTVPYSTAYSTTAWNTALAGVLSGFSGNANVISGIDMYTLMQNGTIALDPDGIHPSNPAGCETTRNLRAARMAAIGLGA